MLLIRSIGLCLGALLSGLPCIAAAPDSGFNKIPIHPVFNDALNPHLQIIEPFDSHHGIGKHRPDLPVFPVLAGNFLRLDNL